MTALKQATGHLHIPVVRGYYAPETSYCPDFWPIRWPHFRTRVRRSGESIDKIIGTVIAKVLTNAPDVLDEKR